MTQSAMKKALRSMVREYGYDDVERSLREIGPSVRRTEAPPRLPALPQPRAQASAGRKRTKVTAAGYVAKMDVPAAKADAVAELARRFDDKSFLPSFGDVVFFCWNYRIDEPLSKSRDSAIPRVFKSLAAMDVAELQRILDLGLFSGPSRLGPIADAIRRNGRAAAAARTASE